MKIILLWDPRFPVSAPVRLAVHDDIASACVRAGIAAAADPAQQGALAAGSPVSADDLRAVALQYGLPGFEQIAHVVLPAAVAQTAASLGLCAAIVGTPIAGGAPSAGLSLDFTSGMPSGVTIGSGTGGMAYNSAGLLVPQQGGIDYGINGGNPGIVSWPDQTNLMSGSPRNWTNGQGGWETYAGGGLTVSTAGASATGIDGSANAASTVNMGSGHGYGGAYNLVQQKNLSGFTVGEVYTAFFVAKAIGGQCQFPFWAGVDGSAADGTQGVRLWTIPNDGKWYQVHLTWTATATTLGLGIGGHPARWNAQDYGGGQMAVDGFTIIKNPSPTRPFLTAGGSRTGGRPTITIPAGVTRLRMSHTDGLRGQVLAVTAGSYEVPADLDRNRFTKIESKAAGVRMPTAITFSDAARYTDTGGRILGGDTFQYTWAIDDELYSPICDGRVPEVGATPYLPANNDANVMLSRFEGTFPTGTAIAVNGMTQFGQAGTPGTDSAYTSFKALGPIAKGKMLVQPVARDNYGIWHDSEGVAQQTSFNPKMVISTDLGRTLSPLPPTGSNTSGPYASPTISDPLGGSPSFAQGANRALNHEFAPEFTGGRLPIVTNDGFWNNGARLMEMSVPDDATLIQTGSAYQWRQTDGSLGPSSGAKTIAAPATPNMCGQPTAVWIAELEIWLVFTWGYVDYTTMPFKSGDTMWFVYAGPTLANLTLIGSKRWNDHAKGEGLYNPAVVTKTIKVQSDGTITGKVVSAGNFLGNSGWYTLCANDFTLTVPA